MHRKVITTGILFIVVGIVVASYNPSFMISADDPPGPPPGPPDDPDPDPTTTPPPRQTHTRTTAPPTYEIEVSCENDHQTIALDEIAEYTITIKNKGDMDTVRIRYDRPSGWFGDISKNSVVLEEGATEEILLEIFPPSSCENGVYTTEVEVESKAGVTTLALETEVHYLGDLTIKNLDYTVNDKDVEFHVLLSNDGEKKDFKIIFSIDDEEIDRKQLEIESLKEAVFPWKLESGEHTISINCLVYDENKENNSMTRMVNFGDYGMSKSEPQMYRESAMSLMNEGEYFEAYYYYCLLKDDEEKERCETYIVAHSYERDGKKLLEEEKYTKAYSFLSEAIEYYKKLGDTEKVSEIENLLSTFSNNVHTGSSSPTTVVKTVPQNTNAGTTITALVAGIALLLFLNMILVLQYYKKKRSQNVEKKYKRIKRKYGI